MSTIPSLSMSVAIATYNGAKYIQEQIDSILAQTHLPDEIVICDDASTDTTVAQLAAYQQKFPGLFRIYRNETNLGHIHNFEKAISLCQGEIIALSDQDDAWLPHKLARMVDVFQRNPQCGLVFSDAEVTNQDLQPKHFTVYSRYIKPDLRPGKTVQSFAHKIHLLGCTSAFRTKYLPYLLPITSNAWGHDHWIVFVLSVISQLCIIDEPLMLYRRHTGHAGNAGAWEENLVQIAARKYKNLSKPDCELSRQKWQDMLQHLLLLRKQNSASIPIQTLEDAITQVRASIAFAEHRMAMRQKMPLLRLLPALHLFTRGDYTKHSAGIKTLVRDLIV